MPALDHPRLKRAKPHHGACPLCPPKRTSTDATGMSALWQKRLNALQQSVAYSITSSARASTSAGMSGLTAVAALRLTMSSELVGAGNRAFAFAGAQPIDRAA